MSGAIINIPADSGWQRRHETALAKNRFHDYGRDGGGGDCSLEYIFEGLST